jgi:hypothetical protein
MADTTTDANPPTSETQEKKKKKSKGITKNDIDGKRKYDAYFAGMAKQKGFSTTGGANSELDKMLRYVLNEMCTNTDTILTKYAKKTQTIRPKLASAALCGMVSGDLFVQATDAASAAVVRFATESKKTPSGETDAAVAEPVAA